VVFQGSGRIVTVQFYSKLICHRYISYAMIVKHFTPLSYTVNNMNMVVHICEVAGILLSVLASALSKEPQILCALVDLQKICNIC
jgi:hypothetical protein